MYTKTVALFGLSGNPSHDGHRAIGLNALNLLPIDEVWYEITPQNPHKSKSELAPFNHRLELNRLLLEGYTHLKSCGLEAEFKAEEDWGNSHTYSFLCQLQLKYPTYHFVWMMGEDNLDSFHKWGNWHEIMHMLPLVAIGREGWELNETCPAVKQFRKYQQYKLGEPFTNVPDCRFLPALHQAQATDIRNALARGSLVEHITPSQLEYIRKHKVYPFP